MLVSAHALELEELAFAVAFEPDCDWEEPLNVSPELILSICSNLIGVEKDKKVQLSHSSVKDYLLSKHESTYNEREINAQILETCHIYLAGRPITNAHRESRQHQAGSLASYAIRYWPLHCRLVDVPVRRKRLANLLAPYLASKASPAFLEWLKVWAPLNNGVEIGRYGSIISEPQTILFLGAAFGFVEVIDLSNDEELRVFSTPEDDAAWLINQLDRPRHWAGLLHDQGSCTCLQLAAQNDNVEFMRHLVQVRKIEWLLEAQFPGCNGSSPLCKAVRLNNIGAAKFLVECGAKKEFVRAVKAATSREMLECLSKADVSQEERNEAFTMLFGQA